MLFIPQGRTASSNTRFIVPPAGGNASAGSVYSQSTSGYTAYQSLGTAVHDSYGISLNSSYVYSVSNPARMSGIIGIDYSGGTSYVDYIGPFWFGGTYPYLDENFYFPMFVPAGASLAIKVSQTGGATVGFFLSAALHEASAHPESEKVCSYWETLGITGADYQGTTMFTGYQLIGTTTRDLQYWDFGINTNDTSHSSTGQGWFGLHVGDGVNFDWMGDIGFWTTSSESLFLHRKGSRIEYFVPAGSNIYLRKWADSSSISNFYAVVYGMI